MARSWNIKFEEFEGDLDVSLIIDGNFEDSYYLFVSDDDLDVDGEASDCVENFIDELKNHGIYLTIEERASLEEEINRRFKNAVSEYYKKGKKERWNSWGGLYYGDTDTEIINSIKNNECYFSQYVIDLCVEKIRRGQTRLVPGVDKVPKNLTLINKEGTKYYGKIESIYVVNEFEANQFDHIEMPLLLGFKTTYKNLILFFEMAYIKNSSNDQTVQFYKFNKNKVDMSLDPVPVVIYSMDECYLYIKSDSPLAPYLSPALNYYTDLMDILNKKSDTVKISIDVALYREYYEVFQNLIVDNDLLVLPVIGKASKLRSISVLIEDLDGKITKYDFYEGSLSPTSKEDSVLYNETFESHEMPLPKNTEFVIVDLVNLSEKDGYLFRKIIGEANCLSCNIVNNIEGEKVKIKRIIQGISNALKGRVTNRRLVDLVCKNDISYVFDSAKKWDPKQYEGYLNHLRTLYNLNEEQIDAIGKINAMQNNVDIMLIQGPPGTGKTELILALAKELSRLNYNTLITSNVHVACDNIVERLKNNKDIVLKRYTAIRGEQYEKEVVINKRKYVENQVLEGFKYKDVIINSRESYDKVRALLEDATTYKKQIIDTRKRYDDELAYYNELQILLKSLNQDCITIGENISLLSNKISDLCNEEYELRNEIIDVETEYSELKAQKDEAKNLFIKLKSTSENKTNELNTIYDIVSKFENEVNIKENENSEFNEIINDLEKQRNEVANYNNFLLDLSEEVIKKELISHYLKNKTFSNNYYKLLITDNLSCVLELVEIYNSLKKDEEYWNGTGNLSNQIIEYLYFSNKKKPILPRFLDGEIVKLLSDVYEYSKCPTAQKVAMSLIPFVKYNNYSRSHYLECIKKINEEFKKIKFYYEDYLSSYIQENLPNEKIDGLRESCISKLNEIIDEINKKKICITSNLEFITITNKEIEKNKKIISSMTKELLSIEIQLSSSKEDLSNKNEIVDKKYDELTSLRNKLDDIIFKIKEKFTKSLKLVYELKVTKKSIVDAKEEINNEYLSHKDLVDNYDMFIKRMIFDLKGIEKEIESYESALKRFDSKLSELKNNGWEEETALEFLFNYVDELEKIVSCPEEKIEHYLDGRGAEFNQMFLLSDNSKGSIVSMTTSQVASLLNSVDKELTFDFAIIDEASKCKFEDIIISLPRVKRLILIGDFMQLDPMYDQYKNIDLKHQNMFNIDEWESFNKSSFSQLLSQLVNINEVNDITSFDNNPFVAVMKRQYRMNKGIYNIIEPIYSIHDGFELIDEKNSTANDVKCININGTETPLSTSQYNIEEGNAIISFLKEFQKNRSQYPNIKSIGVITGYRAQENYLRRNLKSMKIPGIQIGTFDRFQGREYDLVIVSLVRTNKLGFTNNIRRMNVAFSRAKNHLLIFGNIDALNKIANKNTKNDEEYTNSSLKENTFVTKKLIPYLYKIREDYISDEERLESIMRFLKENNYE